MKTFKELREHIIKTGSGYKLVSKKTGKNLGTATSKAGIEKREREVEYFKHQHEETAAWQRKAGKDPKGGLNRKGIASYRAEHPGSHLSMAVTTPPSELKAGSKSANRRKSFCARMGGMEGPMKKPNGEPTRKALALRKWNC